MNAFAETNMPSPPPVYGGYPWDSLYGDTRNIGEPTEETIIYMSSYSSVAETINTLAHEISHQNGILDEDVAEAIGNAAANAYLADSGAKCHGS
jgi:hypothetical protein